MTHIVYVRYKLARREQSYVRFLQLKKMIRNSSD